MKNEVMIRAIGEIDDDLIADAHAAGRNVRLPFRRLGAAAACMLLFFGMLVYLRLPGDTITVDGSSLSDAPVVVQRVLPAVHTAQPKPRTENTLAVSLALSLRDATHIFTKDGGFELLRSEGTPLYTGQDHTASGKLTLVWTIRTPEPTETYRLTVGNTELLLYLDTATECWLIRANQTTHNP